MASQTAAKQQFPQRLWPFVPSRSWKQFYSDGARKNKSTTTLGQASKVSWETRKFARWNHPFFLGAQWAGSNQHTTGNEQTHVGHMFPSPQLSSYLGLRPCVPLFPDSFGDVSIVLSDVFPLCSVCSLFSVVFRCLGQTFGESPRKSRDCACFPEAFRCFPCFPCCPHSEFVQRCPTMLCMCSDAPHCEPFLRKTTRARPTPPRSPIQWRGLWNYPHHMRASQQDPAPPRAQ